METVIKELTQKLKDFKHWERLALMKGENKKADQYGEYAKEYQQAINVLCDGKADSTSEKDLRVCEVIASAWISVKERLPEFNTLVLVNCSIYGRFLASYEFIGEFQGEKYGNWRHNEELGILPPTHWMSIPELPK